MDNTKARLIGVRVSKGDWLEKAAEVGSDYGEDSLLIFPMMLHAKKSQITKKIYYYHRQRAVGVITPYIKDEV